MRLQSVNATLAERLISERNKDYQSAKKVSRLQENVGAFSHCTSSFHDAFLLSSSKSECYVVIRLCAGHAGHQSASGVGAVAWIGGRVEADRLVEEVRAMGEDKSDADGRLRAFRETRLVHGIAMRGGSWTVTIVFFVWQIVGGLQAGSARMCDCPGHIEG
jgi:hypothetical protein